SHVRLPPGYSARTLGQLPRALPDRAESRVLRAVRRIDGGHAPDPRGPGEGRRGIPAGPRDTRRVCRRQRGGPCLAGGLVPRRRLGRVRADTPLGRDARTLCEPAGGGAAPAGGPSAHATGLLA